MSAGGRGAGPAAAGAVTVSDAPAPGLDAELEARLYEFNAQATGIDDGAWLNAAVHDADGRLLGGVSGHTWGGTCELLRVWVHAAHRGTGLGSRLLAAAEAEARRRGCQQILLATFSFQAPRWYERHGFVRLAQVDGYPRGHYSCIYRKPLDGSAGSGRVGPMTTMAGALP